MTYKKMKTDIKNLYRLILDNYTAFCNRPHRIIKKEGHKILGSFVKYQSYLLLQMLCHILVWNNKMYQADNSWVFTEAQFQGQYQHAYS